ncbi:unnamed protein product [Lactuca saligna]|uniref:Alcohol dehydrogenase-like C-terminal domain-containing protein n=1 Tax=Lactuca saligna TaxID=75948 RepID=A0AA35YN79_LACSI|nr:unnamed protein product [Lactuca saligna]
MVGVLLAHLGKLLINILSTFLVLLLTTLMQSGYGRSLFESLLPLILGHDISGEIAAIGQEFFRALHPTSMRGTYTDYAILAEDQLTPKPSTISHVTRGCKCNSFCCPNSMMVLVVGGGGAVGYSAVQLAVVAGCAILATCESESIDRLLAAGAEHALDYTFEDLEVRLKGKYNVVLDPIGIQQTEQL